MPINQLRGTITSQVISGSVDYVTDLPPVATHSGQLWLVKQPERAIFPKYPRGIYYSDGVTWELTPIKTKVSEDAASVLNWTDWNIWYTGSFDIAFGDRIIYNEIQYTNVTGSQTATAPDADNTNWIETPLGFIVETKTTDFTAKSNRIYLVDTGAVIDVYATIPDAIDNSFQCRIYKTSTINDKDVIISTVSSQPIGGGTTQVLTGESEGFYLVSHTDHYDVIQDNRSKVPDKLSRSSGIVSGFEVTVTGASTVDIAPGIYTIEDPTNLEAPRSLFLRFDGAAAPVRKSMSSRSLARYIITLDGICAAIGLLSGLYTLPGFIPAPVIVPVPICIFKSLVAAPSKSKPSLKKPKFVIKLVILVDGFCIVVHLLSQLKIPVPSKCKTKANRGVKTSCSGVGTMFTP